jgi:hypothetical protein
VVAVSPSRTLVFEVFHPDEPDRVIVETSRLDDTQREKRKRPGTKIRQSRPVAGAHTRGRRAA